VKQQLATVRMLFDCLVTGQVAPLNPAAAVRGPKHVVRTGKTPVVFEGRDITDMSVTDVCQLGLTKSYQINQLFERLTVRQNVTIALLGETLGKFRLDLFKSLRSIPGLHEKVEHTLALVKLTERPTRWCRSSPMVRRGGWRVVPQFEFFDP
jgi:hypothetical protein